MATILFYFLFVNILIKQSYSGVLFNRDLGKFGDTIDLTQFGSEIYGQPNKESGDRLTEWMKSPNGTNADESGTYLGGDVLFPTKNQRNGLITESYHWPNGEIPFEIKGNFYAKDMDLIERALNSYHNNTCIKFIPRRAKDVDYISIQSESTGCWSSLGRVGGSQIVNLQNPGCLQTMGTVIHELMHAVGFYHEQNREERDNHIYIAKNNVRPGTENNFDKAPGGTTSSYGVPYDFGSVMHYGAKAFSVNNQPTIVAKGKTNGEMGQRVGFSKFDIAKINKMYKCSRTTSSVSKTQGNSSGGGFGDLFGLFANP